MEQCLRVVNTAVTSAEKMPLPRYSREMTVKALLSPWIGRLFFLLRTVGPYAAIELLLPGGSIVAVLYWWYRHRVSAHG
jgi:hypothetical protein